MTDESIFTHAIDLPPEQRGAYLDLACAGDAEQRVRIDELLRSHEGAGSFLAGAAIQDIAADLDVTVKAAPGTMPSTRGLPSSEKSGDRIGPYKLLQAIGEGGFGTVWMADQEHPVRRRVALKIIKLGMDTKEVVARFEQERQALAMMDHPNIARVFDAGATEQGRPFFVMELVRGMKITDYCDEKNLSTDERVELFILVCQAVQHAHQKGIIHRDIKPSNILVTINDGKAVPKVIDFGVAKATQGKLSDGTLFTQFEQMIGTPLYMSPEQAEMTSVDVDTRSDIYSLGVLLYELLTGRTPIDMTTMAKAGIGEIRRIIREVDPVRPSARLKTLDGNELTTMAKRRHTDPTRLPGTLSGDIDWIVMKCLEKDRARRYDTANGLALDLQRHLANEVVIARPPTAGYLLSKLIRRNKVAFAAGAAIAASLVVGIAASLWQAHRAQDAATQAKAAEERATMALDELRATAPAFAVQARSLAAKEQFNDAIDKLDYAIRLRPNVAEYLVAKADLLQCQFKLAEAAVVYREALRVQPDLARAEASAKLCDELLAAAPGEQGNLTRESLARLQLAMQQQQRPASHLMPVARLLGEEKKFIVEFWLEKLKDLPISPEKPLKERLTMADVGRLTLDLSRSGVSDLEPLRGMPVGWLSLDGCSKVKSLDPLRGAPLRTLILRDISSLDDDALAVITSLTDLKILYLTGTKITDLSALSGLSLETLDLADTKVIDLTALRGMKLTKLDLRNTRVSDLSPLAGMPLTMLDASSIPATDYSPLAGAPLEKCFIQNSPLRDLSFLEGSPVKQLALFNCDEARGYSVLAGLKSLDLLILPQSFRSLPEEDLAAIESLRTHPTLKNIQTEYRSGSWIINTTLSKDDFWEDWDIQKSLVTKLRKSGFKFGFSKLSAGTYSLSIQNQPFSDLSMLKGVPISSLFLLGCPVTDLSPIAGLPLDYLHLGDSQVADLSPLKGMPLKSLILHATKVSDLSPLAGMPLEKLLLSGCNQITDVAALAEIPTLKILTVPTSARNIELLRKLPNLERLAFQMMAKDPWLPVTTTDEFWEEWDGLWWMRALNDAGVKYTASRILDEAPDASRQTHKPSGEGKNKKATGNQVGKPAGMWAVTITSKDFSDCSIFKGATNIGALRLQGTSVTDLHPLEELALAELNLMNTKVTDLSPLRAPALSGSLRVLFIGQTQVTDFSPLAACAHLEDFRAFDTKLADLASLRGLKLRIARLGRTKVTDISVLAGMPLEWVQLNDTAVTDLSPLLKCPTLKQLVLPAGASDVGALRALPALAELSFTNKGVSGLPDQKAAYFWKEYDAQAWLRPLRATGCVKSARQLPDGTWEVDLSNSKFSDLNILKGAPISVLKLGDTAVADLESLHGMALKELNIANTNVTDLRPIKGMPIERLSLRNTKVTDLAALRGMALSTLLLHSCNKLVDLSPLADSKTLTKLTLPPKAMDIEFLRSFPKLERLSFNSNGANPAQTTAEFWKEYDAQEWLPPLRAAGVAIQSVKQLPDGTWELNLIGAKISDLTMLKGAPISKLRLAKSGVVDLKPLRGMALTAVYLDETKVADLSPLHGMPLEQLTLAHTRVTDLSPLRGMPLKLLRINGTGVESIEPLRGMSIDNLLMGYTKVSELSALRGMPLTSFKLGQCENITDLSPIKECKTLKVLTLPPNAKDIEFLRTFPNLERISYKDDPDAKWITAQTAEEFWKEYDAKKQAVRD
ncbi:protein kinase [Prosthecobacter sp.]|uniref:protein kinase domain-containing protein n=1 Tax=Prosthecobacter sp. TaxID=1965333 RepID=UPI001D87DED4|nr:protein kinase [Prosthecobacter sp.]MCB1275560.1 protein kinase [Prosthecobacter sp.]